jgi:Tol biopolymer transport system component
MNFFIRLSLGLSLFLSFSCIIFSSVKLIHNPIQLTFDGNRSGEGYFSKSGKSMCFQAESYRGNPFYQIYVMNLETGVNQLVSNGLGKATCAWIHPDENRVLYASTHLDPLSIQKQKTEFQIRQSGKSRKYSWDYDPNYDLFIKDLEKNSLTQLTSAYGYDAECAFSPNGKQIVFTSNRHIYNESDDKTKQTQNELLLSKHNEIYVMDSDGKGLRRLTYHDGYDGGPFFDSTGNYICWRRFSPDGHKAEIFKMNANGEKKIQLTSLNAMSWAPFFHPSNEYLIFTTNIHGFHNFELYIVDFEGVKAPVRVTNRDGFDGLPSFSPDGKTLSWTSNATPTKKSQIFIADWDHQKALQLIKDSPIKSHPAQDIQLVKSQLPEQPPPAVSHLQFLSSDDLAGRATGSDGMKKASQYVADYFKSQKLKPYNGDWHQKFSFYKHATVDSQSFLKDEINKRKLDTGREWNPLAFSDSGESSIREITFVGFGLRLSSEKNGMEYDSYTHLDVNDKWILCLRGLPSGWTKKKQEEYFYESTLRKKASVARDLGAKGIIFVQDGNASNPEIIGFDGSTREKISIQAFSINNQTRNLIFDRNNKDFKKIFNRFDAGEPQMGFTFKKVDLKYLISITRHKGNCDNTIGYFDLNNNGKLDFPFILVGAHIDHIGRGKHSSRAKKTDFGKIHPGADDNGSGVSALLEIIRRLRENLDLLLKSKYEIAFATWSGEEIGLIGSSHFANQIFGQNKHTQKSPILAYLNMDMVGRMKDKMTIHGVGSSSVWRQIIQQANVPVRLNLNLQNDSHIPTDTTAFYSKGVPIISAFTGLHDDYHSPSDTEDKINYDGIAKCSALFSRIISILGKTDTIDYVSQVRPMGKNRSKLRAFLGTIPNYSQTDSKGVLLSGVSKNGPADKAGLKEGDLIIKLSGKEIENIYDYTEAIGALTAERKVNIVIKRGDKTVTLEIVPKAR